MGRKTRRRTAKVDKRAQRRGVRIAKLAENLQTAIDHCRAGRLEQAAATCRKILNTEPNHPDALNTLGTVLLGRDTPEQALAAFRRALASRPEDARTIYNIGLALSKLGRQEKAIAHYRRALAIKPDYVEAYNNLGFLLKTEGKLDEAVVALQRAVAIDPQHAAAFNNLGLVYEAQGELAEALTAYRRAIALNSNFAEAHLNLGNVLRAQDELEAAAAAHREAIALKPDFAMAHCNLGIVLRELGQLEDAVACHRKALSIAPDYVNGLVNLGLAVRDLGRVEEAMAAFDRALAIQPDFKVARWNRALLLLLLGDMVRGFEEYEWRGRLKIPQPRDFRQPMWDGDDLVGRRILLHAEQGFGDAIQFIRYAPIVAEQGGEVIVECQSELVDLVQNVPGIAQVIARGADLPSFDVHLSLLSLPRVLATTLETVPRDVPYLIAPDPPPFRLAPPPDTRLKVGIAWAGNPNQVNDRNRSCKLSDFAPVLEIPEIAFYSLQVGPRASDLAQIGPDTRIQDLSPKIGSFTDTAGAMAQIDLVITVDTSVAHLAGALARPVWTVLPFLPDWRWLLGRDDCPWYPTMKLFRPKRPCEWGGIFASVADTLRETLAHDPFRLRPVLVPKPTSATRR